MKYILKLTYLILSVICVTSCQYNEIPDNINLEESEMITIPFQLTTNHNKDTRAHFYWMDTSFDPLDQNGSFLLYDSMYADFRTHDVDVSCSLCIDGEWNHLSLPLIRRNKNYNSTYENITFYKTADSDIIYIYLHLPKRIKPKNIKIVFSAVIHTGEINSTAYTATEISNKLFFSDDFRFNNYQGFDFADCFFYSNIEFDDVERWEDFTSKKVVLKRFGSRITYISDVDEYEWNDNWSIYYINSVPVPEDFALNPANLIHDDSHFASSIDYTHFVYNIEDDKLYSIPINDTKNNNNFYSNTPHEKFKIASLGNKEYLPIGGYILPCTKNGDRAKIVPSIDQITNGDGGAHEIKYILAVLTNTNNYKAVLLPLPDKIYQNKKYVIRNKPGVPIFPEEWRSKTEIGRRGESLSIPIVDRKNLIIEEYDM